MELGNILNTKTNANYAGRNMQYEMQPHHHLAQAQNPYLNGRIKSETNSERGASPHLSEPSSRYPSQPAPALQGYNTMPSNMNGGLRYPSPTPMQNQQMSDMGIPAPDPNSLSSYLAQQQTAHQPPYNQQQPPHMQHQQGPQVPLPIPPPMSRADSNNSGQTKAFACSTCAKGFARRSDLARHERIHSGIRPHVCQHPGCGKQFIQRSALTVHTRVHTGEKPHMCERCGKPFSDSSSLARHRRIHSGKRPYKCPYADCQKTFTRRTTLTRHMNHHTGTVEEAAAATAAALASRVSATVRPTRSEGDEYSEHASTPSPNDRPVSLSPSAGLAQIPALHRQPSDYSYMPNMPGMSVPMHLRNQLQQQQPSPRSSPSITPQGYANAGSHRPSLTSHPSSHAQPGYGAPPSVLEPPTGGHHGQAGSANGSPHMTSVGWQSPSHQGLPSPNPAYNYVYPEPQQDGAQAANLYYQQSSNLRRPQSTEPQDAYDQRHRVHGNEMWAAPVQ